jgi:tripartite-type tricarboxylate transporter receptor subunit TctC
MTRRFLALLFLLFASTSSFAAYPDKPIKLISGYPAGGSVDVAARIFGSYLSAELKQTVIVENRAGASGLIGAATIANSPADGHTLYFGVGATMTITPHLNKEADTTALSRLVPIGGVVEYTNILLVNSAVPVKSLAELVDYAKKNPGTVTYGSSGMGSSMHLSGELLRQVTGAPLMHVPYKGAAPAMTDAIGGRITMVFDVISTAVNHVKGGAVIPIAVTSPKRNPMFPSVPTVAELGYPEYEVTSWFALFAPTNLPPEATEKVSAALKAVNANPAFRKKMQESGYELFPADAQQVTNRMRRESQYWAKVISKIQ